MNRFFQFAFPPQQQQQQPNNESQGNYFCHQCNARITPNRDDEGNVICPQCNEGFVEEMEDVPEEFQSPFGAGGHPLEQLLQSLQHQLQAQQQRQAQSDENGTSRFQTRTFNINFDNNQDGELPFTNFLQVLLGGGGQAMDMGAGQSMDDIISHIMENYDGPMGTPPASQEEIENLETVKMQEKDIETGKGCTVCQDDYKVNEEVTKMPCGHLFHKDCLIPWLERHNTCPTCRHELKTDDPDYEQQREDNSQSSNTTSNNNNNNSQY